MLTLLQFNTSLNSGSTGKIAEDIGLTAIHQGWNCYIAHGARYKNQSQLQSMQVGNLFDERIHAGWYSMLFDRHGLGSQGSTKRLIQYIDSTIRPDIIHLHNIHGYYLNYKILFEYLQHSNTKVVWTLHDCWPFTGHCVHFSMIGCDQWKTECRDCRQIHTYPRSLFLDNSDNNFHLKKKLFTSIADRLTVVPVSEWLADYVRQSFLKDCEIQMIHNGIDIHTFVKCGCDNLKSRFNLEDKTVVLGVAAQWSVRKGLHDFIRLRELMPRSKYTFVLIGLSDAQIAELPDGIIGIKRTEDVHELVQWYSAADVFVNPTYQDNYPTVNLEAIACGTPVITYRTGGSPEAITPETGFVVTQGNIQDIIVAIKQIESRGKDAYGRICRDRAEKYFDKTICFQKYLDVYNRLLNN